MATAPISLKGRALRYLAGREHSRAELVRKLARHEEEPGQIERVLDDLQAKDFISEARMVASVINRRAASLGGARLRQELQAKGIDPERVRAAVAELKDTELERAQAVWRKRFGEAATDTKQWARQVRFLMARGFSADVVRSVVPPIAR
ncbi:MAG: recombination regulator RecX [Giesbergeria sp.]|jgi:regulatory protein|nr:recombination regulator RecX [Giesbergeria sp.]MBP6321738.1 recombination regulator RecX [Giesbergeria sp.]MBP6375094.1 recombination regulator RecX [Giesbergeria sp.]MBP7916133.1 recombination regulator RecX [Giesbergeria sp.]MBP8839451.1 recombination regulator RecX [Giesbergeria sp.]